MNNDNAKLQALRKVSDRNMKIKQSSNLKTNLAPANATMPANAIFPGEFEEVQAIMITWNYICLDTNENQTSQLFDGIGWYNDYDLGPVYGVVDTLENSDMAPIFRDLAYGINQNAQVWINLWYPEDTTAVLDYMARQGKPLTNVKFFFHPGNEFWYRDCGPIGYYYGDQDSIGWVDFQYYVGRPLDDSIPQNIGRDMGYPVVTTTVGYEGGNIMLDGLGNLFTSDSLYIHNSDEYGQYYIDEEGQINEIQKTALTKAEVNDSLTHYLNLKSMHVLPGLEYDGGTGHIDLYADFYDENRGVFSRYPYEMRNFTDTKIAGKNVDTIMAIVRSSGDHYYKRYIGFPHNDKGKWYTSSANYLNYTRSYSNHVFVNKAIIQPVFATGTSGDYKDMATDLDTIRMSYPGYTIVPVDVRAFDGFGGAIHCITKQVPAENPIRIMHIDIHDTVAVLQNYPIDATITNKSGIKVANCFWRYKGATEWNSLVMEGLADNHFRTLIPNSVTSGTIEYYISATSNNGKTITKPIVAPGGVYSFTIGTPNDVAEQTIGGIGEFYPQPAGESAMISVGIENEQIGVEIFNSLGSSVYRNSFTLQSAGDAISFNTSSFAPGLYVVVFTTPNGIQSRKLSVIR
jgi:agmatine/peptidylarginine deiminase